MANFKEWLRTEGAFGDQHKEVQCVGMEQFYCQLHASKRNWVLDKSDVTTVARATKPTDEFRSHHASEKGQTEAGVQTKTRERAKRQGFTR